MLTDALPWFLLVVVGLGFLALMVLFRSIIVPAMGVLSSLLSLGAALGITVAVFQWGWFSSIVKLEATGPIFPFLPVMVFAILFGLSCDYQVFLVSRMHEEWVNTKDNRKAVRRGLAGSGRVVAMAAAIMTSVFGAFILGNDATVKLFGVALSTAVLFDAFVVRLVLIPSLMTIVGEPNWWLPGWLSRRPAARQRRVRERHGGGRRRDRRRRGARRRGAGGRAGSGLARRGSATAGGSSGPVVRGRVRGLVERHRSRARHAQPYDPAEAALLGRAQELDAALGELAHGRVEVVADQGQVVARRRCRVHAELARRQPEDEPAVVRVDVRQARARRGRTPVRPPGRRRTRRCGVPVIMGRPPLGTGR